MKRIQLDKDVRPLSEFRSKTAAFLKHIQESKRPLVITQHGKGSAVLLDIGEYESLMDRLETLEDVRTAEKELELGKGLSHDEAKKRILKAL